MVFNIPKAVLYPSAVVGTFGFACLMKDYMGGQRYRKDVPLDNKVAIVTGANTGIGKQIAWEFARRGAKVYLACRNLKKCEETRAEMVIDTKNKYIYCQQCDLASLQSIKDFVSAFKNEEKHLHILINNAGVMRTPKEFRTREGFEMQLGVNHLGHFLLTNLLLDYLKASAPSRIINVSSIAHLRGVINKDDLNSDKEYNAGNAYAQSKLANILFTRELAVKLAGTKVTANAVHPGIVDTEIIRHMGFFNSWLATILIKPFVWPFIKDSRQGAQTVIYTAIDPDLEMVSGKFFSDYNEKEVSSAAEDDSTAKWLWAVSEKWTRLTL